jgi:RNA polymerase sigma factor (TIGR02999 family)
VPTTTRPFDEALRAGDEALRAGDEALRAGDEALRAGDEVLRAGDATLRGDGEALRSGDEALRAGDATGRADEPNGADADRALFQRLYAEVRDLARRKLARERPGHTLTPTALAHEVFLRLAGTELGRGGREELLRAAALVMRRILVDGARRRLAMRCALDARDAPAEPAGADARDAALVALEPALARLGRTDPDLLRVVELRFLIGLGVAETAALLGVSASKVKRDWRTARAFLQREIAREDA